MLIKSFGSFAVVFFATLSIFPQADKTTKSEIPSEPTSCEIARIILDRAFVAFRELENASSLIIIVREGDNESGREVVAERIEDIENFIRFRKVTERYVLATGRRTKALGTADIYVAGELVGVI